MRQIVRIAAGAAAAAMIVLFAASCSDDDDDIIGPGSGPITYMATAFGTQEVNGTTGQLAPTGNPGTGVAVFVDRTTSIDWTLTLDNISTVTASHIHGPALPNQNAGVIFDLFIPTGGTPTGDLNNFTRTGSITGSATVSLDSLRALVNGARAYVNVHTTANPAGAIRGQITRSR